MIEKNIPTPYFLINQKILDDLTDEMENALHKFWKHGIAGYSFKTNNLPWMISHLQEKGLYAEVVSSDEYEMARLLDFPPEHIIFNGPVKGKKEFIEAVTCGSIVNIDSKAELEWLDECGPIRGQIGLRVNFDLEKSCPGETQCGIEDGRFGFSLETGAFEEALRLLQKKEIPLNGLHMHFSSKTRSLNIYRAIAEKAVEIVQENNLHLDYVDIGGGFFGGVPGKPDFSSYFKLVSQIFSEEPLLKDVNLIIEPGMSLVGASVDYISSVTDVKRTAHNVFAVTDGSRTHIDPLMRKSSYACSFLYAHPDLSETVEKQTVAGFTCMENDRIMILKNTRALQTGDRIVYHKTGGYTMCLSPQFIQFYPAVYVNDGTKITCVRKKCRASDFIAIADRG